MTATFQWYDYGKGSLTYDNQPSVDSLLKNEQLLEEVLPVLSSQKYVPNMVKASFVAAREQHKGANLNISSFDDRSWSSWCQRSLSLMYQHMVRINRSTRVRRQICQKTSHANTMRLTSLLKLLGPDSPVIKDESVEDIPRDIEGGDGGSLPMTSPRSTCGSTTVGSSVSSGGRTDFENFNGGKVLKILLQQPQKALASLGHEFEGAGDDPDFGDDDGSDADADLLAQAAAAPPAPSKLPKKKGETAESDGMVGSGSGAATGRGSGRGAGKGRGSGRGAGKGRGSGRGAAKGRGAKGMGRGAKGAAKGGAAGSGGGGAGGDGSDTGVERKPASVRIGAGNLSVIRAKDRVYISCNMGGGKRKQWVQVTDSEASSAGNAMDIISEIFHRVSSGDELGIDDAKRIKQELL